MGHQQGSIDISQLQGIALNTHHASVIGGSPSRRARGSENTTPSSLHACATTATNKLTRRSSRQCTAMQVQRLDNAGLHASQVGLTSTAMSQDPVRSNSTPSYGDTQVAPPWVYIDKGIVPTNASFARPNDEDTGNIDLLGELEQDLQAGGESAQPPDENEDDDVELVSEDIRAEPFPESRRFQQPVTPLVTGSKRKRPMNEETPRLPNSDLPTNPFAGLSTSDMMRPSQIFHATQAQTSPLLIHSDSLSERPSPNINNFGKPSTASSLSSPAAIRDLRSAVTRAVTEPQGTYVSMKESQEARERRLKQMPLQETDPFDDEFEQFSYSQPTFGIKEDGVVRSVGDRYSRRNVPSVSRDRLDAKFKAAPFRGRVARESVDQLSEMFQIPDANSLQDPAGNITEDETEHEEEKEERAIDDEVDELAEDNKENVEVPMTVSRQHHGQMVVSQSSPSRNRVRRGLKKPIAQSATQVVSSPRRTITLSKGPMSESGTQPDAVRDSQSSQQHDSKGISATTAPSRLRSSFETRRVVPQSQASQKSKSSVPQSSIPSKAGSSKGVVNLMTSSPLQPGEPQMRTSRGSSARVEDSDEVKPVNDEDSHHLNDLSRYAGPLERKEQKTPSTESQNLPRTVSQIQAFMNVTIPGIESTAARNAPLRDGVPYSSQDVDSSGSVASSASRIATNQSTNGQSLGDTLFETAQDHSSTPTSKDQLQKVQTVSSGGNTSSPSKKSRFRTFGEITVAPSPPDIEDISLSDFGLLSKDDEAFQDAIRGQVQPDLSQRRQDNDITQNTAQGGAQLVANRGRRRAATLTKWKASTSGPPFGQPGSPTRPTSSAISAPTQVQPSSEARLSSSSPLSSPPASNHEERHSSADSEDFPELLDNQAIRSDQALSTDPPAQKLDLRADTGPMNTLRLQEDYSAQEEHVQAIQSKGVQTVSRFTSDIPIVAPDRVFAHFNGNPSAFYTATCLGVIPGDEPRYRVHYDDGAEDCISAFGIKRLEFRPGDVVKVDLAAHRTKSFVVVGMEEKQEVKDPETLARLRKSNPNDRSAWPETDIFGHAKVLLVPKRVQSIAIEREEGETIAVGMYDLYFTQAMWSNIRDREYIHVDSKLKTSAGSETPLDRPSTPASPSSRLKRLKSASLIQSTYTSGQKQGIFSSMAFTLTNISQPADLDRTKSLILSHGGKVLEDGFDTLFHVPVLHRITSPKKSDLDRYFHPTREAQNLGFTCLIADKHCRRAKYIQALALGIPCLATRWISDCVAKRRILPWSAYLLPAGESTFLGGATHSRVLPALPAETATLSKLLDQRPHMLKGASILLIMAKNEEETMRQHPLLTFALNPTRVARALSVDAAAKAVAEAHAVGEPWDWVFSYDQEREVERILFGNTAKKRKSRVWKGGQEMRTRVIGNEFIIQSLISGQLIEE